MLKNDENKIIRILKLSPIFVIIVSVFISYFIIQINNHRFEKEILLIKKDAIETRKKEIKNEVQKVYDLILNEKNNEEKNIKNNIKNHVYEAYTIATSIYKHNTDKPKHVIASMIKDALRDIRFNDGRGYFFIYDLKGVNIMHPILPKLEGKNLLHIQDNHGKYISKEFISIIKEKKEGFIKWWWSKPNDKTNEYEKLGFGKHFEPFNWFIGTGEYIADYEAVIKNEILKKVQKIRYGENGYVFISDYKGTFISHIKPSFIGQNRLEKTDKKGYFTVKGIIETAKKGQGFISYVGTIKPSTGEAAEKTSFIKGFQDWGWAIGSGAYISDINEDILKKQTQSYQKNKEQITEIMTINIATFIILFLFSVYSSIAIKKRFQTYREKVNVQKEELLTFNNDLEVIVKQRTRKLEETIIDLKETKQDLVAAQKMANLGELVSSLTHEINTPIGISITSASHLEDLTQKISKKFEDEEMTEKEFTSFINNTKELSHILSLNLNNTTKLVQSFRNIAVDQAIEEKREFNLKEYIDEILLSLKNKIKKEEITINVECSNSIQMNTYPGAVSQILINLINNSILHAFLNLIDKKISIIITEIGDKISIEYSDSGNGLTPEVASKIFDKYFTTKRGDGGTGLGLHIVEKIISETLNGQITILEKSKEKGLGFLITIPKIEG